MKSSLPLLFTLVCVGNAWASSCEENFGTRGDPRNGAEFFTSAEVANTSVASALGQLREIATKDGFKVLNEEGNEQEGKLEIEQSRGVAKPFLIHLHAAARGANSEVSIKTRLNRGATARAEDLRPAMCGMIARIKPGAEGEAVAAQAREAAGSTKVIDIKAITLARELDSALKRHNPEIVSARYKGKVYRLDGEIREPLDLDDALEIWYDVFREANWLMPAEIGSDLSRTQVVCRLTGDQLQEGRMLRARDVARLTGTVSHLYNGSPRRLVLNDCKFSY